VHSLNSADTEKVDAAMQQAVALHRHHNLPQLRQELAKINGTQ
jgi:hypothetical protein